jgi:phosphatidylglycerol:prolipoprotein diacylglycerol transferase
MPEISPVARNDDAGAPVSPPMAAMPYFHVGSWDVFGFPLIGFGIIAACGVMLGGALMRRYGEARGVAPDDIRSLFSWVFIGGVAGMHLFDVFVYQHADLARDPLLLVKFWDGISSYGGFIGGALGFALFVRRKRLPVRLLADVTMVGLLPAFTIARIGCTVVSDHIGAAVDPSHWYAFIAEHYPRAEAAVNSGIAELYRANPGSDDLVAWNLGFVEFLYLIPVNALILPLAFRRRLNAGFVAALAGLVYAPVRFFLEFLRPEVSDPRYAGLTFAQWCSIIATVVAAAAAVRIWRRGEPAQVTESAAREPAIALH